MHPIEKVHEMILAGKVLDSSGSWISRIDALKKKRYLLKHILNGEVEVDGRWVSLSSIRFVSPPHPLDRSPVLSRTLVQSGVVENDSPRTTTELLDSQLPKIAAEKPLPVPKPASLPVAQKVAKQENEPLPTAGADIAPVFDKTSPAAVDKEQSVAQPTQEPHPSDPVVEEVSSSSKETIAIRTVSLGSETTLTISESRAGTTLVAICSLRGFLDQSNADEFNDLLLSMLEFGVRFFIIDFEHTTLVGSAGWGILAVSARLIRASGGSLMICAMEKELSESFHLLQFNDVIDAHNSVEECLSIIGEKQQSGNGCNDDKILFPNLGESYAELPLPEKVRSVIAQNGPISLLRILSLLKTERYGKTSTNIIKLYLLLRELNLDSKLKRTRYYRSC